MSDVTWTAISAQALAARIARVEARGSDLVLIERPAEGRPR